MEVNQRQVTIQTNSSNMNLNPVVAEETISIRMNSTRSYHT